MNHKEELNLLKEQIALLNVTENEDILEKINKTVERMGFSPLFKPYGLFFEDYKENEVEILNTHKLIPTQLDDLLIEKDLNKPVNLLLEGDNYQALKLLEKTHKEKIDVIYIDPPYNTGNKDFVYNDSYVNNEDAFRHSKWLSFMDKRLKLAKKLLADDGVIFISIDDNELSQLKLLCDQVFGEQNFINTLSVKTKTSSGASGGGEDKKFKKNIEYLLFYTKSKPNLRMQFPSKETSLIDIIDAKRDEGKSYEYNRVLIDSGVKEPLGTTLDGSGKEIQIFKHVNYEIVSVKDLMKKENISEEDVYFNYHDKIFRTTNAQTSIRDRVNNEVGKRRELTSIQYIPASGKNKGKSIQNLYINGDLFVWLKDTSHKTRSKVVKTEKLGTLWDDLSWNGIASEGGVSFSNGKKPLVFIKRIISMFSKNATVLDFFAGSGTTGHAVMELNKEDGGNRQFILATNNEVSSDKELQLLMSKGYVPQIPDVKKGGPFKEWKQVVSDFKETSSYQEFLKSEDYLNLGIARQVTYERLKRVINGYTTPKGKVVEGLPNNLKYIVLETVSNLDAKKGVYSQKDAVFYFENVMEDLDAEYFKGESKDKVVYVVGDEEEIDNLLSDLKNSTPDKEVFIYTNIVLINQFKHLEDNFTFKKFPNL